MKKNWLKDWPWETIITINAALCKEKKALHKPTSDGYGPAKKIWDSAREHELTLREMLAFVPQMPPARSVLLLQRQHFRCHWPHNYPGNFTKNAARQGAQFPQRGRTLYRRYHWHKGNSSRVS